MRWVDKPELQAGESSPLWSERRKKCLLNALSICENTDKNRSVGYLEFIEGDS